MNSNNVTSQVLTPGIGRISRSEKFSELTKAFIKAKSQFLPIVKTETATVKTTTGQSYSYKYASLDSCYEATNKALSDNGLVVLQTTDYEEKIGKPILITTLIHTSGEFFTSYLSMDIGQFDESKKGPKILQEFGATLTYFRRYAYCLMLSVIGEDDTDGHVHTVFVPPKGQPSDASKLSSLIKESGCDMIDFTTYHNISSKVPASVKDAIENFPLLLKEFKERKLSNGAVEN